MSQPKHTPTPSFRVCVLNEPHQTFNTAIAAIDYATRHVYLPPNQYNTALDTIRDGKPFQWTYGFKSVDITPEGPTETFIVRAVNAFEANQATIARLEAAHEAMLSTLKRMTTAILACTVDDSDGEGARLVEQGCAAIALAEQGGGR